MQFKILSLFKFVIIVIKYNFVTFIFFLFKRLSCELLMAAIPHKDLMQVLSLDRCNGISASDLSEILTEVRYRY